NKPYQVEARGKTIELIEQSVSAQGQPVRKVTVFNRGPSQVQVAGYKIQAMNGKEICSATITHAAQDPATGAVYPKVVQLVWPEEQMKLKMRLEDVTVNKPIDANRSAGLFNRPNLPGVQSYNMAYGPDGPPAALGQPLQRVGDYRRQAVP